MRALYKSKYGRSNCEGSNAALCCASAAAHWHVARHASRITLACLYAARDRVVLCQSDVIREMRRRASVNAPNFSAAIISNSIEPIPIILATREKIDPSHVECAVREWPCCHALPTGHAIVRIFPRVRVQFFKYFFLMKARLNKFLSYRTVSTCGTQYARSISRVQGGSQSTFRFFRGVGYVVGNYWLSPPFLIIQD